MTKLHRKKKGSPKLQQIKEVLLIMKLCKRTRNTFRGSLLQNTCNIMHILEEVSVPGLLCRLKCPEAFKRSQVLEKCSLA